MKTHAKKTLAFSALAALLIAILIGWKSGRDTAVQAPEEIEDYLFWQARELADFKLVAAGGKTLGPDDLKGKWSFIFFGYTQCPDVCPLTMMILGETFRILEKTPAVMPEVQGIFVSVDPGRDTPESLKLYVSHYNDKFVGVTGSAAQLDQFSRQMSALYTVQANSSDGAYTVTHNSTVFLVDPQGRLHGRFPPPQAAKEIAGVFLKIRMFYNERNHKKWLFF